MSVKNIVIIGIILLFAGLSVAFAYDYITFESLRKQCLATLNNSEGVLELSFDVENTDNQAIQIFTDTIREIEGIASTELQTSEDQARGYARDPDNIDPRTEKILQDIASMLSASIIVKLEPGVNQADVEQQIRTQAQRLRLSIKRIDSGTLFHAKTALKDTSFAPAILGGFTSYSEDYSFINRDTLRLCVEGKWELQN